MFFLEKSATIVNTLLVFFTSMAKEGFVYLICDNSNDCFKIGMTKQSLEKRIKELQTGNSTELFVSAYHKTKYPYTVEKMLHNKFSNKHKLNEWFDLKLNDITKFNEYCDEIESLILTMIDNPFFKKKLK